MIILNRGRSFFAMLLCNNLKVIHVFVYIFSEEGFKDELKITKVYV